MFKITKIAPVLFRSPIWTQQLMAGLASKKDDVIGEGTAEADVLSFHGLGAELFGSIGQSLIDAPQHQSSFDV